MEITKKNFAEQLDNITNDLKHSCFVGFDAEFTAILAGEHFQHRLFDSNEERYEKMREDVCHMIMTQIGLTMFQYDRDIDTYVAIGYTFHLCPQTFGDIDQSFIFQASTLEFLCKHNFDFNKFIYEGLPFLSKVEEDKLRQQIKDGTLLQSLIQMLEFDNEKLLQSYCSEVSKWLSTEEEETMYIDVKYPVLRYIVHNEIRSRFPNVMTTDSLGNSNKLLIYRNKEVDGATNASQESLEKKLMTSLLGFSHIISLLERYKKPIVGHNLFLDALLLHNQFIGPLPKKYSTFKKNIHNIFPTIYDTKYISLEMSKKLTMDEVWKSNALQVLYEFFAEVKCKKLEIGVNPIRLSTPFDVKQSYHEAGWDSFCSGYCFIRLAHWAACEARGKARPVGPSELLAALDLYCNKVNIIRAAVRYMNLVDNDPVPHRPSLLYVKALNERVINITRVASALANYGAIDIKAHGRRTALVAAGSQVTVDRILKNYKHSKEYKISQYSALKHSVAGRVALWSDSKQNKRSAKKSCESDLFFDTDDEDISPKKRSKAIKCLSKAKSAEVKNTSSSNTSEWLFDSESDSEVSRPPNLPNKTTSILTRRVPGGVTRRTAQLDGDLLVELRLYNQKEVSNLSGLDRCERAIVWVRLQGEAESPEFYALKKFVKLAKAKFTTEGIFYKDKVKK